MIQTLDKPTFFFIGVTTGKSSIMKVFPEWATYLNLGDVQIHGLDFEVHDALKHISCDVLVLHDKDDQEVAIEDVFPMINGHNHVKLVQTEGEGHRKILASRVLLKAIKEFMYVP